ncbi:Hypothetical predicted protein [Paramuricea clavata]|uniref:Uncharacterized protein n=1 Tax=Paramuricea clavata TaxID=317549 RepID=A0A7D9LPT1_PARCT|nr:Hypothetical predicted protein [Paramuricea clavata]
MQICFFRNKPELPHLCVEDQILECVWSHKVLGLIIQDDLKWNEHISVIVTKASKRLHILRVLRRGGIPPHDLITIYYALIRSTLEYCCTVWHCGLPMYLSEQVEKIQKRALRIILPGRSYGEAQEMLQCPRLDIRRGELCEKTMKNIALGSRLSFHLTLTSENEHVLNEALKNNCMDDQLAETTIIIDINEIYNKWFDGFYSVLDQYFPQQVVTIRPNDKPWMNSKVRLAIRKRDRLLRKHNRTKTVLSWQNYKRQRNRTTAIIRCAKASFHEKSNDWLCDPHGGPKQWWSISRKLCVKMISNIPALKENGIAIENPVHKAQIFGDHFSQTQLYDNTTELPHLVSFPSDKRIGLIFVSYSEVLSIFKNINVSKASGHDGIGNKVIKALDDGKEVRVVFLDVSKAFDRVWHTGLLFKLQKLGVQDPLLSWIKNYLCDRKQRVVMEGQSWEWKSINSGVPQGSVLGPLLFLVYINDITEGRESIPLLFADDTALLEIVDSPDKSAFTLNNDLEKISNWSQKCHYEPFKMRSYCLFS